MSVLDPGTVQLTIEDMRLGDHALNRSGRHLATFTIVVCDIELRGWAVTRPASGNLTIAPPRLRYGNDRRAVVFPDDRWLALVRDAAIAVYDELLMIAAC